MGITFPNRGGNQIIVKHMGASPDFGSATHICFPVSLCICRSDFCKVGALYEFAEQQLLPYTLHKYKYSMEREIYGFKVLFERLQYDKAAFSTSESKQTSIAVTGIKNKERQDLIHVAELCGIHYNETIKRKVTTHLVVGPHNPTPASVLRAIEANIPVLHIHWLLDSIYHVQPLPTEKYLLVSIDPRLNLFMQHQTQPSQSQSQPSQPTPTETQQQQHRMPMQSIDNIAPTIPPTSASTQKNNEVTQTLDLQTVASNDTHVPIVIEEEDSGDTQSSSLRQIEQDQDNPLHAVIMTNLQNSLQLKQQKEDVMEQEQELERECSPLSPSHLSLSPLNRAAAAAFTPLPSFNGYDDDNHCEYENNCIDSIGLTPNPPTYIQEEEGEASYAAAASPTPSLTPPPSQSNNIMTGGDDNIIADTDEEEIDGDDNDDDNSTQVNNIDHNITPYSLLLPPSVAVCIEDDESDYFPSPGMTSDNDGNNKTNMFSRRGNSSGLTQLSPSEIKIAKPCMAALSCPSSTKLLPKPPQGSTVKEVYGLSSLRGVQFAQQIVSDDLSVVVNVKDTSQMLRIVIEEEEVDNGDTDGEGSNACQLLGQAVYLYKSAKINNNEWQLEYHQMYSKKDVAQLVQHGKNIHNNSSSNSNNIVGATSNLLGSSCSNSVLDCMGDDEVVKSCFTRHGAVSDIQGAVPCLKMSAKAGATALNLSDTVKGGGGGGGNKKRYVWKGTTFDPYTLELL